MVSFQWQVLRSLLLLLLLAVAVAVSGFRFDQDTGENCKERSIQECSTDKITYFQCPITCAKALEPESGASSSGSLDDEAFYELQAQDVNGNTIQFEKFQGYVTVIAAIPLLKGVAQFHYEMLEHLHDVYPFTLEILIVPLQKGDAEIVPHEKPNVTILRPAAKPVLQLLHKSAHGSTMFTDKVTLYLVGADGNTVEAFVSPTMENFQRYLRYHFVQDLSPREF